MVRAFYIVPRVEDWPAIMPILGRYLGDIRPTNTAIIAGLVDPRMRIEIEVTARKPKAKAKRKAAAPRRRR